MLEAAQRNICLGGHVHHQVHIFEPLHIIRMCMRNVNEHSVARTAAFYPLSYDVTSLIRIWANLIKKP